MKGIQKYELTVMIEKNLSTNERKLKREIEKLLSQSVQLRQVKLVQVIKVYMNLLRSIQFVREGGKKRAWKESACRFERRVG